MMRKGYKKIVYKLFDTEEYVFGIDVETKNITHLLLECGHHATVDGKQTRATKFYCPHDTMLRSGKVDQKAWYWTIEGYKEQNFSPFFIIRALAQREKWFNEISR